MKRTVLLSLFFISFFYSTTSASNGTLTLNPVDDSYVRGGSYDGNTYGSEDIIVTKKNSNLAYQRYSYLKFDLSNVPQTITSATLRLYVNSSNGNSTQTVYLVTDDSWTESGITYSNKPAGSTTLGSKNIDDTEGFYIEIALDLAEVKAQVTAPDDDYLSIQIKSNNGQYTTYNSKEAGANHPELVLVYPNPVTGVSIDQTGPINLAPGKQTTLTATVSPADAANKGISWSSSSSSIASVNSSGVVTAGSTESPATITVTTNDGGFTAQIQINVQCPNVIPANFTAIKGYTEVTLTWDALEGADQYKIFLATNSGAYDYNTPKTTVDGAETSAIITGLTNGTPYYFVIKTVMGICESDPSSEVTATPSDIYEYENAGVYISTVASNKNLGAGISAIRIDGHANLSKGFTGYTTPLGYLVDISVPNGANPLDACLTFSYAPEDIPEGMNLATLDIYRFNEGTQTWDKMNGTHNMEERKIEVCGIDEFSHWTLAGSAPESVPLKNWGILIVLLAAIATIVLRKI